MKSKVYIRADGNNEIGLGHVIRCLALADMLNSDFDCIFITRFLTSYIETEARKVCRDIIKLSESDEHFEQFLSILNGTEIVVLDNYFYSSAYQMSIKEKGCSLVCIDDIHDKCFVSDVVINHAGGLKRELYANIAYCALYTGTEYALLRKAFLYREKGNGDSILISMGGADKDNAILEILKLLEKKDIRQKCFVVIGDAYIYIDELKEFSEQSGLNIQIQKNLSAEQMSALMLKCQTIICPPSSISYEYLSLRGGEMYLKVIADNQEDLYKFFTGAKIAFDISELFVGDVDTIDEYINIQEQYFDGKSGIRIRQIFKRLEQEQRLSLRDAVLADMDLYFRWVNDPDERRNAINQQIISYEEHCNWFKRKIVSDDCYLWLLEQDHVPIGQIRFDIIDGYAVLSYFLDKDFRGKGLGLTILRLGLRKILKLQNNLRIRAVVRRNNQASCWLFERLNFHKEMVGIDLCEYTK